MKSATASEDLSSCLIHYSNQDCQGQGNQFVDSLVMQACVTAAHSQDPGDPSVLVIMCGAPISQLPPSWHLMPPLTPGVMKNINFVYPQINIFFSVGDVKVEIKETWFYQVFVFSSICKVFIEAFDEFRVFAL